MYGYIVVITRNGSLGGRYPLVSSECLFGQSSNCDVRVYVDNVARRHCLITALPNEKAYICNLSASNTTLVNSIPIEAEPRQLEHADVITVGDRHFRWEYPPSACPPATPKHIEKANSPACMVQVPLSVFKNKRHSSAGLVKEKVSVSSEGDEPNTKRRKTIHNITDLSVENQLSKPVNKRLQALTQPVSSPKSFNTFKVLLKSASKKKSMTPVSKTPKGKKMSSVKVKRSLSQSPPILDLKSSTSKLNTPKKRKSEITTSLERTNKKISPATCSKSPTLSMSSEDKSKTKMSPQKSVKAPKLKKLNSSLTKKRIKLSRKTLSPVNKNSKRNPISRGSLPASFKILAKGSKISKVVKTPKVKKLLTKPASTPTSSRGRTPKTPAGTKSQNIVSPSKTPRGRPPKAEGESSLSRNSSPAKSPSLTRTPRGRTPKIRSVAKTPSRKSLPTKSVSPSKTPRGRLSKAEGERSLSRSSSPAKSASPTTTPKGRMPKIRSVAKTPSRKSSPTKSVSPLKTPRGKLSKAEGERSLSRNSFPAKSPSPTRTPRGRTPKIRSVAKTPSRKSLPTKSVSPSKTPRGRLSKAEGERSLSRSSSPAKSASSTTTPKGRTPKIRSVAKTPTRESSPTKSVSPSKTPRGRSPKIKEERPSSRNSSPAKSISPTKTPRGRTPKTHQVPKTSSRGSSPVKLVSPAKTPRGRPPSRKTSPAKLVTPGKTPRDSSPDKSVSSAKSLSGRPPKDQEEERLSSRNSSPAKSMSPTETTRGRTPKTPQVPKTSSTGSSPVKPVSPAKTPRGRPPSRKTSPAKLVTPGISPRDSLPDKSVFSVKSLRGRPPKDQEEERLSSRNTSPVFDLSPTNIPTETKRKTPLAAKSSSRESSPVKTVTPMKTPRGRLPKTEGRRPLSRNSSPAKPVLTTKTPRGTAPKTPTRESSPTKSISLSKTPIVSSLKANEEKSSSRSSSPAKLMSPSKTPRGRTPKMRQVAKTPSRETSPEELVSPAQSPRGRPPSRNTSLTKPVSPTKTLPMESSPGNISPSKTPIGRPSDNKKERSSTRSLSPAKSVSPDKTLRERTPQMLKVAKNTLRDVSPVNSNSPPKTPRGRPPSKNTSPAKSETPAKTLRERLSKTPHLVNSSLRDSSSRKSVSPSRTPSETQSRRLSSRNTSPAKSVSPIKTPTGRTPETSLITKPSSRESSPAKSVSPTKTPRGQSPSRHTSPTKSVSPSKTRSVHVNDTPSVKLPITPKPAESLNEADTTRSLRSISTKEKELFIFKATPIPKHNRASILRTSLHHDVETLFSEERNETPSVVSTSTHPLSLTKSRRSSINPVSESKKRKFSDDVEAKAELAAKKLKMETPKSLSKNKKAAIIVCHGRSPIRKPLLFSEVLKHRLSEAKRKPSQPMPAKPAIKKLAKPKSFEPSLVVPETFKFNSTGHANSPETIVIRKKMIKTPVRPKLQRGRKAKSMILQKPSGSKEATLDGVPELFKTPSKAMVSSLKSATSVKKGPNVRVRFSLHNNVQSPSGRSSLVPHTDETPFPGSPTVSSKKYVRTPRLSSRTSIGARASLLHTSIVEESPLAQDIESSRETRTSASPKRLSGQSNDFSVYSPSSPTMNLSNISSLSPLMARKSINFDNISTVSEVEESPQTSPSPADSKAKRRSNESIMSDFSHTSSVTTQSVNKSGDLFDTSANSRVSGSLKRKRSIISVEDSFKQSPSERDSSLNSSRSSRKISVGRRFQPSPDQNALLSTSDLNNSTRLTRTLQKSTFDSSNDPRSSLLSSESTKSPKNRISQIPLPPSGSGMRLSKEQTSTLSSSKSNESNRSTRSQHSIQDSYKSLDSPSIFKKLETWTLSASTSGNSATKEQAGAKRASSTPKAQKSNLEKSPVSSPIFTTDRQSRSSNLHLSVTGDYNQDERIYNTPSTSGRKPKHHSTRMRASNSNEETPEGQLPVAAVKPSTRKKQGNESLTSPSQSVSLPNMSNSHEVTGRSLDQSLSRKIIDSRFIDSQMSSHQISSQSSSVENNSYSGSGRRKRKSSVVNSPKSIGNISFDFSLVATPRVPQEVFISPLEEPHDTLSGVKRMFNPTANSPVSSYVNVKGVKRLMKTPKESPSYMSVEGIKSLFRQTPTANYSNVEGLKHLYNLTHTPNYMNIKGVRRIFKEPKGLDSPDVTGLEVLFESPKKVIDDHSEPSTSKPIGKVTPMKRTKSDKEVDGAGSQETLAQTTNSDTPPRTRKTTNLSTRNTRQSSQNHQSPIKSRKSRKTAAQNGSVDQESQAINAVLEDDQKSPLKKKSTRGRKATVQNNSRAQEQQEKPVDLQEDHKGTLEKKTRRGRKPAVENDSEDQRYQSPLEKKTRRGKKGLANESSIQELSKKSKSTEKGNQTRISQTEAGESSDSVLGKRTKGDKKEETTSKRKLVTESKTDEELVGVSTKKSTRSLVEASLEETSTSTRRKRNAGKAKVLEASKQKRKSTKSIEQHHEASYSELPEVKNVRKVRGKVGKLEPDVKISSLGRTKDEPGNEESNVRGKRIARSKENVETMENKGEKLGKRALTGNIAELNETPSPPKKARKESERPGEIQQLPKNSQKKDESSLESKAKSTSVRATRSKKNAPNQSPTKIKEVAPSTSEESPKQRGRKQKDLKNTKKSKDVEQILLPEETTHVETDKKVGRGRPKAKDKVLAKGEKEEVDKTAKLEERLKKDEVLVQKSAKVNKSKKSEEEKSKRLPKRRVQFNTCAQVFSITPSLGRRSKRKSSDCSLKTPSKSIDKKTATLKTKATTKLKASSKRPSTSPIKSPPAKRVTRSRK